MSVDNFETSQVSAQKAVTMVTDLLEQAEAAFEVEKSKEDFVEEVSEICLFYLLSRISKTKTQTVSNRLAKFLTGLRCFQAGRTDITDEILQNIQKQIYDSQLNNPGESPFSQIQSSDHSTSYADLEFTSNDSDDTPVTSTQIRDIPIKLRYRPNRSSTVVSNDGDVRSRGNSESVLTSKAGIDSVQEISELGDTQEMVVGLEGSKNTVIPSTCDRESVNSKSCDLKNSKQSDVCAPEKSVAASSHGDDLNKRDDSDSIRRKDDVSVERSLCSLNFGLCSRSSTSEPHVEQIKRSVLSVSNIETNQPIPRIRISLVDGHHIIRSQEASERSELSTHNKEGSRPRSSKTLLGDEVAQAVENELRLNSDASLGLVTEPPGCNAISQEISEKAKSTPRKILSASEQVHNLETEQKRSDHGENSPPRECKSPLENVNSEICSDKSLIVDSVIVCNSKLGESVVVDSNSCEDLSFPVEKTSVVSKQNTEQADVRKEADIGEDRSILCEPVLAEEQDDKNVRRNKNRRKRLRRKKIEREQRKETQESFTASFESSGLRPSQDSQKSGRCHCLQSQTLAKSRLSVKAKKGRWEVASQEIAASGSFIVSYAEGVSGIKSPCLASQERRKLKRLRDKRQRPKIQWEVHQHADLSFGSPVDVVRRNKQGVQRSDVTWLVGDEQEHEAVNFDEKVRKIRKQGNSFTVHSYTDSSSMVASCHVQSTTSASGFEVTPQQSGALGQDLRLHVDEQTIPRDCANLESEERSERPVTVGCEVIAKQSARLCFVDAAVSPFRSFSPRPSSSDRVGVSLAYPTFEMNASNDASGVGCLVANVEATSVPEQSEVVSESTDLEPRATPAVASCSEESSLELLTGEAHKPDEAAITDGFEKDILSSTSPDDDKAATTLAVPAESSPGSDAPTSQLTPTAEDAVIESVSELSAQILDAVQSGSQASTESHNTSSLSHSTEAATDRHDSLPLSNKSDASIQLLDSHPLIEPEGLEEADVGSECATAPVGHLPQTMLGDSEQIEGEDPLLSKASPPSISGDQPESAAEIPTVSSEIGDMGDLPADFCASSVGDDLQDIGDLFVLRIDDSDTRPSSMSPEWPPKWSGLNGSNDWDTDEEDQCCAASKEASVDNESDIQFTQDTATSSVFCDSTAIGDISEDFQLSQSAIAKMERAMKARSASVCSNPGDPSYREAKDANIVVKPVEVHGGESSSAFDGSATSPSKKLERAINTICELKTAKENLGLQKSLGGPPAASDACTDETVSVVRTTAHTASLTAHKPSYTNPVSDRFTTNQSVDQTSSTVTATTPVGGNDRTVVVKPPSNQSKTPCKVLPSSSPPVPVRLSEVLVSPPIPLIAKKIRIVTRLADGEETEEVENRQLEKDSLDTQKDERRDAHAGGILAKETEDIGFDSDGSSPLIIEETQPGSPDEYLYNTLNLTKSGADTPHRSSDAPSPVAGDVLGADVDSADVVGVDVDSADIERPVASGVSLVPKPVSSVVCPEPRSNRQSIQRKLFQGPETPEKDSDPEALEQKVNSHHQNVVMESLRKEKPVTRRSGILDSSLSKAFFELPKRQRTKTPKVKTKITRPKSAAKTPKISVSPSTRRDDVYSFHGSQSDTEIPKRPEDQLELVYAKKSPPLQCPDMYRALIPDETVCAKKSPPQLIEHPPVIPESSVVSTSDSSRKRDAQAKAYTDDLVGGSRSGIVTRSRKKSEMSVSDGETVNGVKEKLGIKSRAAKEIGSKKGKRGSARLSTGVEAGPAKDTEGRPEAIVEEEEETRVASMPTERQENTTAVVVRPAVLEELSAADDFARQLPPSTTSLRRRHSTSCLEGRRLRVNLGSRLQLPQSSQDCQLIYTYKGSFKKAYISPIQVPQVSLPRLTEAEVARLTCRSVSAMGSLDSSYYGMKMKRLSVDLTPVENNIFVAAMENRTCENPTAETLVDQNPGSFGFPALPVREGERCEDSSCPETTSISDFETQSGCVLNSDNQTSSSFRLNLRGAGIRVDLPKPKSLAAFTISIASGQSRSASTAAPCSSDESRHESHWTTSPPERITICEERIEQNDQRHEVTTSDDVKERKRNEKLYQENTSTVEIRILGLRSVSDGTNKKPGSLMDIDASQEDKVSGDPQIKDSHEVDDDDVEYVQVTEGPSAPSSSTERTPSPSLLDLERCDHPRQYKDFASVVIRPKESSIGASQTDSPSVASQIIRTDPAQTPDSLVEPTSSFIHQPIVDKTRSIDTTLKAVVSTLGSTSSQWRGVEGKKDEGSPMLEEMDVRLACQFPSSQEDFFAPDLEQSAVAGMPQDIATPALVQDGAESGPPTVLEENQLEGVKEAVLVQDLQGVECLSEDRRNENGVLLVVHDSREISQETPVDTRETLGLEKTPSPKNLGILGKYKKLRHKAAERIQKRNGALGKKQPVMISPEIELASPRTKSLPETSESKHSAKPISVHSEPDPPETTNKLKSPELGVVSENTAKVIRASHSKKLQPLYDWDGGRTSQETVVDLREGVTHRSRASFDSRKECETVPSKRSPLKPRKSIRQSGKATEQLEIVMLVDEEVDHVDTTGQPESLEVISRSVRKKTKICFVQNTLGQLVDQEPPIDHDKNSSEIENSGKATSTSPQTKRSSAENAAKLRQGEGRQELHVRDRSSSTSEFEEPSSSNPKAYVSEKKKRSQKARERERLDDSESPDTIEVVSLSPGQSSESEVSAVHLSPVAAKPQEIIESLHSRQPSSDSPNLDQKSNQSRERPKMFGKENVKIDSQPATLGDKPPSVRISPDDNQSDVNKKGSKKKKLTAVTERLEDESHASRDIGETLDLRQKQSGKVLANPVEDRAEANTAVRQRKKKAKSAVDSSHHADASVVDMESKKSRIASLCCSPIPESEQKLSTFMEGLQVESSHIGDTESRPNPDPTSCAPSLDLQPEQIGKVLEIPEEYRIEASSAVRKRKKKARLAFDSSDDCQASAAVVVKKESKKKTLKVSIPRFSPIPELKQKSPAGTEPVRDESKDPRDDGETEPHTDGDATSNAPTLDLQQEKPGKVQEVPEANETEASVAARKQKKKALGVINTSEDDQTGTAVVFKNENLASGTLRCFSVPENLSSITERLQNVRTTPEIAEDIESCANTNGIYAKQTLYSNQEQSPKGPDRENENSIAIPKQKKNLQSDTTKSEDTHTVAFESGKKQSKKESGSASPPDEFTSNQEMQTVASDTDKKESKKKKKESKNASSANEKASNKEKQAEATEPDKKESGSASPSDEFTSNQEMPTVASETDQKESKKKNKESKNASSANEKASNIKIQAEVTEPEKKESKKESGSASPPHEFTSNQEMPTVASETDKKESKKKKKESENASSANKKASHKEIQAEATEPEKKESKKESGSASPPHEFTSNQDMHTVASETDKKESKKKKKDPKNASSANEKTSNKEIQAEATEPEKKESKKKNNELKGISSSANEKASDQEIQTDATELDKKESKKKTEKEIKNGSPANEQASDQSSKERSDPSKRFATPIIVVRRTLSNRGIRKSLRADAESEKAVNDTVEAVSKGLADVAGPDSKGSETSAEKYNRLQSGGDLEDDRSSMKREIAVEQTRGLELGQFQKSGKRRKETAAAEELVANVWKFTGESSSRNGQLETIDRQDGFLVPRAESAMSQQRRRCRSTSTCDSEPRTGQGSVVTGNGGPPTPPREKRFHSPDHSEQSEALASGAESVATSTRSYLPVTYYNSPSRSNSLESGRISATTSFSPGTEVVTDFETEPTAVSKSLLQRRSPEDEWTEQYINYINSRASAEQKRSPKSIRKAKRKVVKTSRSFNQSGVWKVTPIADSDRRRGRKKDILTSVLDRFGTSPAPRYEEEPICSSSESGRRKRKRRRALSVNRCDTTAHDRRWRARDLSPAVEWVPETPAQAQGSSVFATFPQPEESRQGLQNYSASPRQAGNLGSVQPPAFSFEQRPAPASVNAEAHTLDAKTRNPSGTSNDSRFSKLQSPRISRINSNFEYSESEVERRPKRKSRKLHSAFNDYLHTPTPSEDQLGAENDPARAWQAKALTGLTSTPFICKQNAQFDTTLSYVKRFVNPAKPTPGLLGTVPDVSPIDRRTSRAFTPEYSPFETRTKSSLGRPHSTDSPGGRPEPGGSYKALGRLEGLTTPQSQKRQVVTSSSAEAPPLPLDLSDHRSSSDLTRPKSRSVSSSQPSSPRRKATKNNPASHERPTTSRADEPQRSGVSNEGLDQAGSSSSVGKDAIESTGSDDEKTAPPVMRRRDFGAPLDLSGGLDLSGSSWRFAADSKKRAVSTGGAITTESATSEHGKKRVKATRRDQSDSRMSQESPSFGRTSSRAPSTSSEKIVCHIPPAVKLDSMEVDKVIGALGGRDKLSPKAISVIKAAPRSSSFNVYLVPSRQPKHFHK